jgi:hypothetical protein
MMMWNLICVAFLSVTGIPVEARPVTGPVVRGVLVELSSEAAVIQVDGNPQRLELVSLWDLSSTTEPPVAERLPTVWVELVDGSQIQAVRYTVTAGEAAIGLTDGRSLAVKTRSIQSVRFRVYSSAPELATQWEDIASTRPGSDLVVIRRSDNLDTLEGMIRDVTDEAVKFEFAGQTIDAKRAKLDGIVYYHPLSDNVAERLAQVVDVAGSRWNVKSLTLAEDQLEWVSVCGVKFSLPIAQLGKIDFSSGNTLWLDDLQPESLDWQPFIPSKLPRDKLASLFDPRRSAGLGGKPLELDGQVFDRGLSLRSRTELTYRLTGDYRRFHALVGIDDRVREAGHVHLTITADDRELFSQAVTGRDEPIPLELDITGARRLKILVDFGEELDIADHLNLCDARITK